MGPQDSSEQGKVSERFGRNDLSEEELKLVCNDNLLWIADIVVSQSKPMRQTRTWRSPWNNHRTQNSGNNHLPTCEEQDSLVGMSFQASWRGRRRR